jgi:hypothetical protein
MSVAAQRHLALERANEVRLRRSQARLEVRLMTQRDARTRVAELLLECPDWLHSESVQQLLEWIPRIGPRTAPRLLAPIDVHQVRYVGESSGGRRALTERQRRLLAQTLTR